MSDEPIDTAGMPADQAVRYETMVREKRRVEAEAATMRGRPVVAEAEAAVLRRALGLHSLTEGKPRTMG